MELNHFSHPHPLILSEETFHEFHRCSACCEPIIGLCYCCEECPYILHKWCAELPRELTHHRLHPDHPLILFLNPPEEPSEEDSICEACKLGIHGGFTFHCTQCSFNLHCDCASYEFRDHPNSVANDNKLTFRKCINYDLDSRYKCFLCREEGFGSCFHNVPENDGDNIYSFHIHCAILPLTVKHERHLHHLTLHPPIQKDLDYDECYCDACEQDRVPEHWIYYCETCEFAAYPSCGITRSDRPKQQILDTNLIYTALEKKYNDSKLDKTIEYSFECLPILCCVKDFIKELGRRMRDEEELEDLQHFSHRHPLFLYDEQSYVTTRCEACRISIFGKAYICNDCKFFLHKRCAELPRDILHRLHSEHPLTLVPMHDFKCKYCRKWGEGFSFSCQECDFELHTTCALLPENPIHHESHEHPLIPVICTPYSGRSGFTEESKFQIRCFQRQSCNACRYTCNGISLECAQCGFYLHLVCALYSPIGKAKTHMHSLALDYSYQEDPNALEFICDACEKPRTPNCWLYRCMDAKCYFVAHIDCAAPKIFHTSSFELMSKHQNQKQTLTFHQSEAQSSTGSNGYKVGLHIFSSMFYKLFQEYNHHNL